MAKLGGDAVVYHDGGIIRPGDTLPKELAHLADEPDTEPSPASSGAGIDPDFDADKATVPQLRAELDRLGVQYADDDRKDALKDAYKGRIAS